jgi:excisionase family DNA binding protein
MSEKQSSDWLTTEEAVQYLKVHPETLRNWVRKGAIPAAKLGNRGGYRFRRDDLDRFLDTRAGR